MARGPDPNRTLGVTKLAALRLKSGKTQQQLSTETGISLRSLQRLENGLNDNPSFAWVANLAIALECDYTELVEATWTQWHVVSKFAPRPPQEMADGERPLRARELLDKARA